MARTPTSPASAHHRLMRNMVSNALEGFQPTPEELNRVSRVFQQMGGSWVSVFLGSADDVTLLRRVLKGAAKKGLLSKNSKWG